MWDEQLRLQAFRERRGSAGYRGPAGSIGDVELANIVSMDEESLAQLAVRKALPQAGQPPRECVICLDLKPVDQDVWVAFPCAHSCCQPCFADLLRCARGAGQHTKRSRGASARRSLPGAPLPSPPACLPAGTTRACSGTATWWPALSAARWPPLSGGPRGRSPRPARGPCRPPSPGPGAASPTLFILFADLFVKPGILKKAKITLMRS